MPRSECAPGHHRYHHSDTDPAVVTMLDTVDEQPGNKRAGAARLLRPLNSTSIPTLSEAALRRAASEPVFDEVKDRRLLHALKNQQRWLVNWILDRTEGEEEGEGGASAMEVVCEAAGMALPPRERSPARRAQAFINERDADERTPLHFAARWGDLDTVKRLVAIGADVRAEDAHGHSPVDEAEYWGHQAVVDYLRSLGTQREEVEGVVEAGDVRLLKDLLLRGVPIKDFTTVLHKAAARGDEAMIRLLLAAGVDAHQRDEEGHSAAEVALMSGHMSAFEMLNGASRGKIGRPKALGEEQEVSSPELVESGPSKTPIHAAAECGSVEAVLRLGKIWPVDSLDAELNTPLHVAIINGHPEVARVLVRDLKADVNKRNRWSTTPLAEAVRLGQDEIAAMLRDHGACLFLEIDSQQVVMEPRDQYFLRLELVASLLSWAALPNPRPSIVRFFHTTHHNSLLLCCSVRPRVVPDNRSSSSSIRSWGSSVDDGDTDDTSPSRGEEEADSVLAHLVLDDRAWFLSEAFRTNAPVVVADAACKDPNELFLSPVMSYTQHKHLAVLPVVIDGRRLGAFVCLFKGPETPRLPANILSEIHSLVSGTEKELAAWLSAPSTDAPRLQLLLQSRLLKARIREWVASVYSQESYNFWGPNRQMCALVDALYAYRRTLLLPDVCQRCPWIQQMMDAIFYQSEVLLPVNPSRQLYSTNYEASQELKTMGLRPPDLRTQDSPVYSNWLQQVRSWTEQAEPFERALVVASQAAAKAEKACASANPAPLALHRREGSSSNLPWCFSHRDVFDLIGKHKYDHTLPELLSQLAIAEQPFPWFDRSFAEGLSSKLSGSGAMRQQAVLGVVTHYLYRTFLHPQELHKAWHAMQLIARKLMEGGRAATGVFVVYKSVLEFLHPFHDGNGRFARSVASILLRRAGYTRALLHSDNKILALKDFFDILLKEVNHRTAAAEAKAKAAVEAAEVANAGAVKQNTPPPSPREHVGQAGGGECLTSMMPRSL